MASEDETTLSKTVHTVSPFLQLIHHLKRNTKLSCLWENLSGSNSPYFTPIFHTVSAPRNCRSPRCSPVPIFEAMPHLPCGSAFHPPGGLAAEAPKNRETNPSSYSGSIRLKSIFFGVWIRKSRILQTVWMWSMAFHLRLAFCKRPMRKSCRTRRFTRQKKYRRLSWPATSATRPRQRLDRRTCLRICWSRSYKEQT